MVEHAGEGAGVLMGREVRLVPEGWEHPRTAALGIDAFDLPGFGG